MCGWRGLARRLARGSCGRRGMRATAPVTRTSRGYVHIFDIDNMSSGEKYQVRALLFSLSNLKLCTYPARVYVTGAAPSAS